MIAILFSSMIYNVISSCLFTLINGIIPMIGQLFRPDVIIYIVSDLLRGLLDLWNNCGLTNVLEQVWLTELWEQSTYPFLLLSDLCTYYGLTSLWETLSYYWTHYGLMVLWNQLELLWNNVGLWSSLLWFQNGLSDLLVEHGLHGSLLTEVGGSIWEYLDTAFTFCDDSFKSVVKYLVKVIHKADMTTYSFPSFWYSGIYGGFNGLDGDFYSVYFGMPIPEAD